MVYLFFISGLLATIGIANADAPTYKKIGYTVMVGTITGLCIFLIGI